MSLIERIKKDGLVLDGAMGTMLIKAGLQGGETSESWVLEKPEEISKVHRSYIKAGAEVVTTCTFGANSIKLKKAGLAEKADQINTTAVQLARQEAGETVLVAGNIGPTGEMFAPMGTLTREDAQQSFTQQAKALAAENVDLFLIQTFFDLQELLCAIEAIKAVSDKPIFATMTFQEKPSGFFTIMGNKVKDSMQALANAGCMVVGANCSISSEAMVRLATELREAVSIPVLAQPNAGAPEVKDGIVHYNQSAKEFAANMAKIKALNVDVLGGCCGTTPEYIQAVQDTLNR